ncbi:MAG TPA: pitrilysin family protein [Vicinamibacterales bacterium]|jgi:predicted Zn-dependent peptidase
MARATAVDRSKLPVPGPVRSFGLPAIEKSALANGLRVWTIRHAQVPLLSFVLLIDKGAAADPAGQDGLAALAADMLDEGSGDRSAIQMHEALALIGAQFDTDIGSDATAVSVTSLSRVADRALAIVGDIVVRPALREADFARVRQLRLHRLKQLRDSPSAVADRTFLKLVYGDDPYGHSPIGSETSLSAVTIDDVRAFHLREIVPAGTTLIAVGDCEHNSVVRLAENVFGGWTASRVQSLHGIPAAPPAAARLAVVPRSGAPQSELRIGQIAAARSTPDYHPLAVANTILGGQFVSRINLNLREDKGFTYGARTAFEFRRRRGPFVLQASVQSAATAQAIAESLGEIAAMRGARQVTPDELSFGIAALTRGYARNFETADQISRAVMQLALYDLPDDYYAQYVARVESVTRDEVTRVMTEHLDPSRFTTVIVGDPAIFGGELDRLGLGAPQVLSTDAF